MATNLEIEDALIEKARQAGGHKTKKEAVTAALEEYIRHRQQLSVLELRGTIDYDPDYDYKSARRRKHLKHVKPK
jgi:Arc/MetJ family transcription regulator